MNSYYFHPIVIDGSFAHATDSGIYTRAVSSGSQDSILIVVFFSQKLGIQEKSPNFNDYFRRKDRKKDK